jgi:hypothetical protein
MHAGLLLAGVEHADPPTDGIVQDRPHSGSSSQLILDLDAIVDGDGLRLRSFAQRDKGFPAALFPAAPPSFRVSPTNRGISPSGTTRSGQALGGLPILQLG